ncbi:MAG: preprotein translocase subunit YajC [Phycisphaerales bacterium JB040]
MDIDTLFTLPVLALQEGVGGMVGAESAPPPPGQETAPGGGVGPGTGSGQPASPFGSMFLPLILGFLVLMIFTTFMSGRREKKAKNELMSSLARHDRVQLSGGMIGTLTEITPDEVVVRVDDTNKTTIRFVKSAVVRVVKHANAGGGGGEAIEPKSEVSKQPAAV